MIELGGGEIDRRDFMVASAMGAGVGSWLLGRPAWGQSGGGSGGGDGGAAPPPRPAPPQRRSTG
jgi:hypothetical protein